MSGYQLRTIFRGFNWSERERLQTRATVKRCASQTTQMLSNDYLVRKISVPYTTTLLPSAHIRRVFGVSDDVFMKKNEGK